VVDGPDFEGLCAQVRAAPNRAQRALELAEEIRRRRLARPSQWDLEGMKLLLEETHLMGIAEGIRQGQEEARASKPGSPKAEVVAGLTEHFVRAFSVSELRRLCAFERVGVDLPEGPLVRADAARLVAAALLKDRGIYGAAQLLAQQRPKRADEYRAWVVTVTGAPCGPLVPHG